MLNERLDIGFEAPTFERLVATCVCRTHPFDLVRSAVDDRQQGRPISPRSPFTQMCEAMILGKG
jgi:hypothetical protein